MTHASSRTFLVRALAGLLIALVLPAARPRAQQSAAPGSSADVTYILPLYEQFAGLSDAQLAVEIAKLRSRIGPDGPYVKVGFTTYVPIIMQNLNVDVNDPVAIRAAMQGTINNIDEDIRKARTAGFPICLNFLTAIRAGYDQLQLEAENEDVRNTQWFGGQDVTVDNTLSLGWLGHTRYARRYEAVQEAYLRELGKILANRMQLYPDTLVASAGDGEVELSFEKTPIVNGNYTTDTMLLADYSPFAILEFRDWLTAGGLYAPGQAFDGQAYVNASRYTNNLGQINADFGTAFTTFSLRYFDWQLNNEAGSRISKAQFNAVGFDRRPVNNPGGFDAPRLRNWDSPWWQVWLEFRRQMLLRHNTDFARWITTSADSGPGSGNTGATVPTTRWYSYQIPADRLYGLTPEDRNNLRYETSASAWWTADVSPYGRLGTTAFNLYYGPPPGPGPACGSADPKINFFCRTLVGLAPQIAARQLRFALLEWHPGVGNNGLFPAVSDIYGEEMKLVEQYRPALLVPYALYTVDPNDPSKFDPEKPFYDSGFETSLKAVIARMNATTGSPSDPHMSIDSPDPGTSVNEPFEFRGWALDTGTIRAPGFGAGVDHVEVYATPAGGAESLLGNATYGATRSDIAALYGAQFGQSGFTFTVNGLASGNYTFRLVAYSKNTSNGGNQQVTVNLNVTGVAITTIPAMSVDAPSGEVGRTFTVQGWAIDRGSSSGSGVDTVHVYSAPIVNGVAGAQTFLGQATYGSTRNDLGTIFGSRFTNSGYSLATTLANGQYRLTVYARSTVTGTFNNSQNVDINVVAPGPVMSIDNPPNGGTRGQSFNLFGWAVDRAATTGTGVDLVHVYAYPIVGTGFGTPIFVGQATYGSGRGDVAAAYGSQFNNCGFSLPVTLAFGTYRIVVLARSTVTGTANSTYADVTVSGPVANPIMSLDGPTDNSIVVQPVITGGWAVDLGAPTGSGVDAIHVWAFPVVNGVIDTAHGIFVAQGTSGGSRPDVGAFYGSQFTNSGYTFILTGLPPGTYELGVYARSTVSNTFNNQKFVQITIQ